MAKISLEDRIVIKYLRVVKHYGAKKIVKELEHRHWSLSTIKKMIKKIDETGSTRRKVGSGRPRSARTPANIQTVQDMICSRDSEPGTHKSPREIARQTGISRTTIQRIAKIDLKLTVYKRMKAQKLNADCKTKRIERCRQLLDRFPNERSVRRVWFTDEKTFTVATPVNTQNDRLYSTATMKKFVSSEPEVTD
jgi:AraC-like DNA-binding protein